MNHTTIIITFCTALDLATPGKPLPDLIFCPITSCFRLLKRTSKGLFLVSLLLSDFLFFFRATTTWLFGFPISTTLVSRVATPPRPRGDRPL